jgi:molybdopterin converting factor small subunit
MSARVEIPSALQGLTNNQRIVDVPDGTVKDVFASLLDQHGRLRDHLYDEKGRVRSFINIYVNDEDIRYAQELQTPVKAGDVVHIIPSIAGG